MITNTHREHTGNIYPDHVISCKTKINHVHFETHNGVQLTVWVLTDATLRFRYASEGEYEPDFSYAISKKATFGFNTFKVDETHLDYYAIHTSKLEVRVRKDSLRVSIYDTEGNLINEDEKGYHWEENYEYGGNIVKMSKVSQQSECYYGLGDKASQLNLRGRRVHNWCTDQYAYGKDQEPLYKSIPFYVGLFDSKAYGIFFDNSFKTFFDFCSERMGITSYWADGGEMNYYFFYGPSMADVVSAYTDLTGKPYLPPLWALGFHQSKWSYYPEANVKEIANKFRELRIPCDAIYLDIDYMEGFRCFTWNNDYFPDPKRMVKELEEDGFKTVAIIDAGIKIDKSYEIYQEGIEKDYFCRRADGPYAKGKVWPGLCYFPDFTKPEVREWWAGLHQELIADIGVRGVWNDMNEPAVMEVPSKTLPLDVRHDYDSHPCSHRKAHNVYGMQMSRATSRAIKDYAFPRRPFVITRAAYAGAQRYTSTWTGDNLATWEHLWIANVQVQRMCMSGMSFVGTDIGGFAEQPNGELFVRWIQLGIFHPLCRVHSSGDHGNQEPWSFDEEVLNITRKFIELRYQLLPYVYTTFWQYFREGTPMVKSLVYYDQHDPNTNYRNDEFVFGDHFLVCPINEPNGKGRRMYIPRGSWYNYWTRELVEGGKEMWVDADLDSMPIFIKEGAIVPKYPVQQYVGEKQISELELEVYFKEGKEKSMIFEDAGDGFDYKKSKYCLRSFNMTGKSDDLVIMHYKEGKYFTEYEKFRIKLIGLPFEVKKIQIDNEEVPLESVHFNDSCIITINKEFNELHIFGKDQ